MAYSPNVKRQPNPQEDAQSFTVRTMIVTNFIAVKIHIAQVCNNILKCAKAIPGEVNLDGFSDN